MIKPELCKDRKTFAKIELDKYYAERKFDGERIIAIKKGDDIILQRRSGKIATHQYPEIVEAMKTFQYDITLDGEMCVFIHGKDEFDEGIATRTHLKSEKKIKDRSETYPATYMVFDVLHVHNTNKKMLPLETRKRHLQSYYDVYVLNTDAEERIKLIDYVTDAVRLYSDAKIHSWEGIVMKPKDAMYIENSRIQWIKIKNTYDSDFVFTSYEDNKTGLKLFKYTYDKRDDIILDVSQKPIVVQCNGAKADEVREILERDKEVLVTIGYLNLTGGNRLRMPVFRKIVDDK